jgi:Flp pilus assembly pilin Flp
MCARVWAWVRGRRDNGASVVEYGVLFAVICGVMAAALFLLGSVLSSALADTSSCIGAQISATC